MLIFIQFTFNESFNTFRRTEGNVFRFLQVFNAIIDKQINCKGNRGWITQGHWVKPKVAYLVEYRFLICGSDLQF